MLCHCHLDDRIHAHFQDNPAPQFTHLRSKPQQFWTTDEHLRSCAEYVWLSGRTACLHSFVFLPFVSTVLIDEGVVSPRLSSSCTQKRTTSAKASCTLGASSTAQTSGEKASPSHEKFTQPRKHQRIENFSACCIFRIPAPASHHDRLLTDAAI